MVLAYVRLSCPCASCALRCNAQPPCHAPCRRSALNGGLCMLPLQASGIGSQLHVLGLALAVAMDTNRVLLMNTHVDEAMFTNDAYCGEQGEVCRGMAC